MRTLTFVAALFLLTALACAEEPVLKHVGKAANATIDVDSLDDITVEPEAITPGDKRRDHLEATVFRREDPVEYLSNGRRDPFRPLIVDEKKVDNEADTDLLLLEDATLTGVVWSTGQYLALVKDKEGRNFFLRDGDPIYQGHVTLVTQSTATFEISDFGDYSKITLKVQVKGKSKDRNRDKDQG